VNIALSVIDIHLWIRLLSLLVSRLCCLHRLPRHLTLSNHRNVTWEPPHAFSGLFEVVEVQVRLPESTEVSPLLSVDVVIDGKFILSALGRSGAS
jgi:hypothetical protein